MPCLLHFLCLPICLNSAGAQGHHTTTQGHAHTAAPWSCNRARHAYTHVACQVISYWQPALSHGSRTRTHTHTRPCIYTHLHTPLPNYPMTPPTNCPTPGAHPPAPITHGHCKTSLPYAWATGTHAFSQHLAHTSTQFAMFSTFCSTLHQCLNPDIGYLCVYIRGKPGPPLPCTTRTRRSREAHHSAHISPLHLHGGSRTMWRRSGSTQMILLQVHLQKPCYDFSFL